MKYTQKSFSVGASPTKQYRDNWDHIFGKVQPRTCRHHGDCEFSEQVAGETQHHCEDENCKNHLGA